MRKPHTSMGFVRLVLTAALLTGILGPGASRSVQAAGGPGGIIQGIMPYPEFPTTGMNPFVGPVGYLEQAEDGPPPYPAIDDPAHTPGMPGVRVYAKNNVTGALSPTVTTDSKGVFVIPNQEAGSYSVCWIAPEGLTSGCSQTKFDVIDQVSSRWVTNLGSEISVDLSPDPTTLTFEGYVTATGAPPPYDPGINTACVHNDPFFRVDDTAKVELYDSSDSLIASTRANSLGRYLLALPQVSPGAATSYTLKASCGRNTGSTVVSASSPRNYIPLSIPANRFPRISSVTAEVRLRGLVHEISGAPHGAFVTVTTAANDADGDALHYRWRPTDGRVTTTPATHRGDGRLSRVGAIVSTELPTVLWRLPDGGRGLHFLYVEVSDAKGGYDVRRVAISTDSGFVEAIPAAPGPAQPADSLIEPDRFLTYRGIDTEKSACEYYKAIQAVQDCDPDGSPTGWRMTFNEWRQRNGLSLSINQPVSDEIVTKFRNVADLNLVRNHHARRVVEVSPTQIAYYVCNHALPAGVNLPVGNLVACVAMEYSVTPGQNDGRPFTKFYTFGPTGKLYLSVNLDGRGEKYTPGTCVPCHGGDAYFHRFPSQEWGARDANIGAYFLPFDLDNFEFDSGPNSRFTRAAQEDNVRSLNLLLKDIDPTTSDPTAGNVITRAGTELIDGWYPRGAGVQQARFLPAGWDPTVDTRPEVPPNRPGDRFSAADLYLHVVKPSCRGCHIAMGPKLGLDFHRYAADPGFDRNDPSARPGDFVGGNAVIQRSHYNSLHTGESVCAKYYDGLPTYNILEDINTPARTMPQAIQTFNRMWNNAGQVTPSPITLINEFLQREQGEPPENVCISSGP